jgi:hypothetical protein
LAQRWWCHIADRQEGSRWRTTYATAPLFVHAFCATGLPITEAYWGNVKVGGDHTDVLIECFERRCLTYTPGNPAGWQVEAGNVGQRYYEWRYGNNDPDPAGRIRVISERVGMP